MKMKKMRAALAAMTMVALTFTACSGDDGETGPAGPAGAPGNANVNANTFTVLQDDFTISATQVSQTTARVRHRDTLDVPSITSSVMNSGSIQVYYSSSVFSDDTTAWTPMPNVASGITFSNDIAEGEVRLNINYINTFQNGQASVVPIGNFDIKVVVIPSASLVKGVDINNYEEVKMVYGIEEYDLNSID